MTKATRAIALLIVGALVTVSCATLGSAGFNGRPADLYAAGPTLTDVRTLFGDNNWWQGPPSFEVPPLDAATMPFTERFAVTQQYTHIGTAEQWLVRYTVYDKTTSATARMTELQNAFGASPSTPKVGDAVLYYGLGGSGGAPFVTRTFVRVGQIVVTIIWARKDPTTTVQELGRNASKVVEGLKKVIAGKVRATPPAIDAKLVPPPGLDITFLGAAQLPIEAWLSMDLLALPGAVLVLLHNEGITTFVYGDYALNNDTHMEVRTSLITFPTTTAATDWLTTFGPGNPDSSGIASAYIPTGGTAAAGEYHYYFTSGTYGGMLVCKPSLDGEAASRECESPMERTAIAWKLALGGLA